MNPRRKEFLKEMELTPVWKAKKRVLSAESPVLSKKSGKGSDATQDSGPRTQDVGLRTQILSMGWEELTKSAMKCTACRLCEQRTQAVVGAGDRHAQWLFVGEGPGAEEDLRGEPFVGQAGKLLDNMLAAINLKRGDNVYIANTVKCRPPGNRHPQPDEMEACSPYLQRQIQLIQPKLIIALGKAAVQGLLKTDEAIMRLRGRVHRYLETPLIVTYHPAYLLRNLPDKAKGWEDLCFARKTMQSLLSEGVKE